LVELVSFAGTNGAYPSGKLALGNDGALYGTTEKGGPEDKGTIFSVSTNGELQMIAAFTGTNGPNFGQQPGGLCLAQDGAFYGCTSYGGNGTNTGTTYSITPGGSFSSLATFSPNEHGNLVNGRLAEGPDGAFYGTARIGGPAGNGTVFRVTSAGALSVVAAFNGTNGGQPMAPVTVGLDGVLYGTTYSGGQDYNGNHRGTVFRCTIEGGLSTLHDFPVGNQGYYPRSSLVQASNGVLYGTTDLSGSAGTYGTLFSISTNGAWTNLLTFRLTNGTAFSDSPVLASDGSFYGTTPGGGAARAGMVFQWVSGQDLSPLAVFRCGTNGTAPTSLLQTSEGLLYGITRSGGTNNVGTVFCMDTNGSLLFSSSLHPTIGSIPSSPLIKAPDGYLYGFAQEGGAYGYGSIYRVTTGGVLSAVASFNNTNGSGPRGPFWMDADGTIFGLTERGGAHDQGAMFRASTNGAVFCVVSLSINSIAGYPRFGLMRASDGAFYGTSGWVANYPNGTVFRITTNGVLTLVGSFGSSTGTPESTPFEAGDGYIYGTTRNCFFRFRTNGLFAILSQLNYPWARGPLTVGPDGAFYSVATSYTEGAIIRISTNGSLRTLMNFSSRTTGASASSGLILGQDNRLYGTTEFGQTFNGNVFSVDVSSRMDVPILQGSAVVLSFSGMPNISYQVQRSALPAGPWSNLAGVTLNSAGNGSYTNFAAPSTNAFYRLRVN